MTKLLRTLIDEENTRRGKKYPQVGALTTFTKGFGMPDDIRVAEIINEQGGLIQVCHARVRDFRKYLELESRSDRQETKMKFKYRDVAKNYGRIYDKNGNKVGSWSVDNQKTELR